MIFRRNGFFVRLGVAACTLIAGTQLVAAAADADIARGFGLIGNWAPSCALPAAPKNPHQAFAVAADGSIALTMKSGGSAPDTVIAIRDVKLIGADMISGQWSAPKSNAAILVTLQKKDNRIHSWESVDAKGEKLVDKGVYVSVGKPAPWASKCP